MPDKEEPKVVGKVTLTYTISMYDDNSHKTDISVKGEDALTLPQTVLGIGEHICLLAKSKLLPTLGIPEETVKEKTENGD